MLARFEDEAASLAHSRGLLAEEARRAQATLEQAAANHQQADERRKSAQHALDLDRRRCTAVHKRQAELAGHLTGARQRIELLEELEQRLEGLTAGAKEVLHLARSNPQGPFGRLRGVVADLLHVDADTVVLAFGVRPATSLTDALAGRAGVVSVGDCVNPAKVGEAINAGFMAALTV